MAKKNELPGFVKKRKILFGEKVSPEQRRTTGIEFMEAGRYDDALEFFARADAGEYVRKIANIAREEGNVPIYLRAKGVLEEKPEQDDFEELAGKALEKNRPSMAVVAYQKAGLEEQADRLRSEVFGEEAQDEEEAGEGEEGEK